MTSIPEKTCRLCKETKPVTREFFFKKPSTKDGFDQICKICIPIYKKWLKERVVEPKDLTQRTCITCGLTKPATTEFFTSARGAALSGRCKDCRNKSRRADPDQPLVVLPHLCSHCGEMKPTRAFGNQSLRGVTRDLICTACRATLPTLALIVTRRKNEALPDGQRWCSGCGVIKPATREFFYKSSVGRLDSRCIDCTKTITKSPEYRASQKEYRARIEAVTPGYFTALVKAQNEKAKERDFLGFVQRRREIHQRWVEAHPEEARAQGRVGQHKRRWQKLNQTEGEHHTWVDVERMLDDQDGLCAYCEVELQEYHVDHVHPLSRSGSNSADNLVVACPLCNFSKNDRTLDEWLHRPTKQQAELWYADDTKGRGRLKAS